MRGLALSAALVFVGCKAIPLGGDPTMPQVDTRVSPPAVYHVDWWTRLVFTGELPGLRGNDPVGMLEYKPQESARPAVDPDTERIIVATRDGFVRCLSPVDGHVEWQQATHGRFYAGSVVVDGIVYVPGGDGVLYALRVLTGEQVWQYKSGEELVTVPVVKEGKVLVASQSETLFAVDTQTGKWVWQYKRNAPSGFTVRGTAQPLVRDGLAYMGFADGALVALGLQDGVARWERRLTLSGGVQFLDVDTAPVMDDAGQLFAASYKDGIYALDAKTGDILWSSARSGVTSLLLQGAVLIAAGDGTISALETRQGKVLWTLDLSDKDSKGRGANAGGAPMLARGYVVVPTSTALAFVDPGSGRVRAAWNPGRGVTATPAKYSSLRVGSRLYVLSNLGTVYALQLVGHGS